MGGRVILMFRVRRWNSTATLADTFLIHFDTVTTARSPAMVLLGHFVRNSAD
jgi:hypothetical protein